MKHLFDVDIAKQVGINGAVLLENLYFWIKKNEANRKHYYDGKYWLYNSVEAFTELFPYLTYDAIRYALEKLQKQGYIITGNHNKLPMDKTKWYALTEKAYSALENSQMDLGKFPNGAGNNPKAIPDNKPDIKKKESTKDGDRQSYEDIINSLVEDSSVREALQAYLQMRVMQKKAPSNNALILLVDRLKELSSKPKEQISIINQSIRGGYPDFYSLQKQRSSTSNGTKKQPKRDAIMKPIDMTQFYLKEDGTYDIHRFADGRKVPVF